MLTDQSRELQSSLIINVDPLVFMLVGWSPQTSRDWVRQNARCSCSGPFSHQIRNIYVFDVPYSMPRMSDFLLILGWAVMRPVLCYQDGVDMPVLTNLLKPLEIIVRACGDQGFYFFHLFILDLEVASVLLVWLNGWDPALTDLHRI
jgi:hypothetical protein